MIRRNQYLLFFLLLLIALSTSTAQERERKVLMIGIDGCRFDAILYSQAKQLKKLIKGSAYTDQCDVLDTKGTKADTASGPGWSTILTGVWADRHQVWGNDFRDHSLEDCPTVFHLANRVKPDLNGVALVTWPPIHDHICQGHKACRLVLDGDAKGYRDADRAVADAAIKLLDKKDPDLMFIYFGNVDSCGHGYGFHPKSPKYTNGIEEVDGHLVRVFKALVERPTYGKEDWLVMVFTDHGGKGKGHGGGRNVPEIRMGFLVLKGDAVSPGEITEKVTNADLVPTALTHLGIPIDSAWRLEGRAVGLKKRGSPPKKPQPLKKR